jgi:monofunctional biosynthetic peptidoglycan transglycosylase
LRRAVPPGWVPIHAISPFAIGAVVVSEDWNFFRHDGYDAAEIKEAIKRDLVEGRFARGASTITQQVVKNVFLEQDKTLWRKLREFVLSVELDEQLTKKRILEVYFNIVEWGHGIYGIRAASQAYFSKSPSELTAGESAFLALLLPSPKRYSQSFRDQRLTPFAKRTQRNILRKMVKAGYLTQDEYLTQAQARLAFEKVDSVEALPVVSSETESEEDPLPRVGEVERNEAEESAETLTQDEPNP